MLISVIIPTYRRPDHLNRCLEALAHQSRRPDEVLVVARDDDEQTKSYVSQLATRGAAAELVTVTMPGQIAALNAGLSVAQGDVIAFTDDDAAPHANWVAKIQDQFDSDPRVGGLGGRDILVRALSADKRVVVGRVQWFGRLIGNHHLGTGEAREVEILKGVNMSYRRVAIRGLRFDARFRGEGAQVCNDLAFSLAVRRRGWRLIYDPTLVVDHELGPRIGEDSRGIPSPLSIANAVYNETLALLDYLPAGRRVIFVFWALLVGAGWSPGLAQLPRLLLRDPRQAWLWLAASLAGRLAGIRTWWRCSRSSHAREVVRS